MALPMVTLMIPQEVILVEQTVMEAEPVLLLVVKVIFEPEMLVATTPLFWLELFNTVYEPEPPEIPIVI